MNQGYIKLYHSFLEWEWYTDLPVQAVFLHLLLTVNRKAVKLKGSVQKKGSRRISIKEMSAELGMTVRNVRTALDKLDDSGYIEKSQYRGITLFTVPRAHVNRPGSYVKLYRKFVNWEWYKSSKERSVYIYSLLHARRFTMEDRGVLLKVGSYAKSFPAISKDLGLSLESVRSSFRNLQSTDDLKTVANRQLRVVSVFNYATYHKYEEDTDKVPTDGFNTFSENLENSNRPTNRLTEGISHNELDSYDCDPDDSDKVSGNLSTNDRHPTDQLYNKREESVKSEKVKDKTRQSSADAVGVASSFSDKDMDDMLKEAGLLTSVEKEYILNEIYKQMPKQAIELFRKTIKETYGLATQAEVITFRDQVVTFQVEAYVDSIEVSSEGKVIDSAVKWSCFRYKSKHYKINILQDIAALLLYETFTATIPIDKTERKRLLRCLETLAKSGIAGSDLYSFFLWCHDGPLADKLVTEDVVHTYLFNSRKLPQLITQYFQ